jgi:hypothetical protein
MQKSDNFSFVYNCVFQFGHHTAHLTLCIMMSQDFMPARNAGLNSHCLGKLNNSKWPLSKFSWTVMTTKARRTREQLAELTASRGS